MEDGESGLGSASLVGAEAFRGLYESGAMSLREIAKETGLNRRTVAKDLSGGKPVAPPRRAANGQPFRRVVDEVAPLIDAMLRAEILLKGAVIHQRLVAEYGFTGSYQRIKMYLQEAWPLRPDPPRRTTQLPAPSSTCFARRT